MRLVVATPHYPPEAGGPATYAKILSDHLPAMGVPVEVVRFEEVRRFPKLLRPLLFLRLVLRSARKGDLILALDPVSTGVPAALAAWILAKPLVVKVVGDSAWERSRQPYGMALSLDEFVRTRRVPFEVACFRRAQSWVAARARRIIVPSAYLKTIVCAWGVPERKVRVIYNAVRPPHPAPLPEGAAFDGGFTIVTAARLVRWKHIDEVIAAVKQIPDAKLLVVGDGPDRARLERLVNGDPRIRFLGQLPNSETLAIMANSDALVLNSSYEGLSHVLIEGLMAGVPIVATDTGGNPEVLADGSGLLVPVGDTPALESALQRLKDDPELRDRLRQAATKRAKAFSTATMLQQTKVLLEEVQSRG